MNTKRMAAVRRKSSAPPPATRLQAAERDESEELPAVLPHQRTLRDLYSDAVRARVALKPNERNFDENPSRMSAGEMLLWTLGGAVCDHELSTALAKLSTDMLCLVMAPEAHGSEGLPADVCDTINGFVNRLQIIRWLHTAALERLGQIVAPEIAEEV
jgi:hypothetical protein